MKRKLASEDGEKGSRCGGHQLDSCGVKTTAPGDVCSVNFGGCGTWMCHFQELCAYPGKKGMFRRGLLGMSNEQARRLGPAAAGAATGSAFACRFFSGFGAGASSSSASSSEDQPARPPPRWPLSQLPQALLLSCPRSRSALCSLAFTALPFLLSFLNSGPRLLGSSILATVSGTWAITALSCQSCTTAKCACAPRRAKVCRGLARS